MKVACLQEDLSRGLSVVRRAVAKRNSLPILSHILLATERGKVKLSATNMAIAITYWLEAEVSEAGITTVPAGLLYDFINSMPPERIDLTFSEETQTLKVKCSHFEATLRGLDAQEFPTIPALRKARNVIKIAPDTLKQLIDQVCFAAATDEGQPVLTGVLAEFGIDSLTLAATDVFRLAQKTIPLKDPISSPCKVIIPAHTLQELSRILSRQISPVQIVISPRRNQILFHLDQIDVVSQLLEGQYPDFSQVIPRQHTTRIELNTPVFLNAARVSHLFSQDAANSVRLDISPSHNGTDGSLVLKAQSQTLGENIIELAAKIHGQPLKIAFNTRYLIDALSVLDSSQVILETSTPSNPGLIYPPNDRNLNYVICPMHL